MSLKTIQSLAAQLVEDDKGLHDDYDKYEAMIHGRWNLPSGLDNVAGIRKTTISDPYDAMNSVRRILAKDLPKITVSPIAPTEGSKEIANMQEKGLTWMYKQASERRATDLTGDLAWSAGLYGQIIGQVSYLPHEIEAREAFKGDSQRLRTALMDGLFIVELHNPKFVHVMRSSYGIEGVMAKKLIRASEAIQFWGDYAGSLNTAYNKLSDDEKNKAWVTQYDYWDNKKRTVWCVMSNLPHTMMSPDDKGAIKIMVEEDYGMEFMPWFARMTGSGLDHDIKDQIQPMLKPVKDADLFDTMNTLETLIMSKSIKLYGRPTLAEEGPNPATTEIDFGPENSGDIAKVPPMNQLKPMDLQVLDTALLTMADRSSARIDKSTVSRLLQTGEFPSGMAASAINIVTQSAVESIGPTRRVAEHAISDIARLMLLSVHYSGKPVVVDGASNEMQIVLDPATINPDYIYIETELTAVAPADDVARANAAQMWAQIGMPQEDIFERSGERDPQGRMKAARKEQFEMAMFKEKLADIELRIQAKQMQLQMMAQQQMQQQQMAAQQQQQQQVPQTPPTGVGGQGMNPAAGGMSAVGPSGATFEQQTGTDRGGLPL